LDQYYSRPEQSLSFKYQHNILLIQFFCDEILENTGESNTTIF